MVKSFLSKSSGPNLTQEQVIQAQCQKLELGFFHLHKNFKRTEMNWKDKKAKMESKKWKPKSNQHAAIFLVRVSPPPPPPPSPFRSLWPSEEAWTIPGIEDRRKKMNLREKEEKWRKKIYLPSFEKFEAGDIDKERKSRLGHFLGYFVRFWVL